MSSKSTANKSLQQKATLTISVKRLVQLFQYRNTKHYSMFCTPFTSANDEKGLFLGDFFYPLEVI
jgi:hypothetical protein